MFFSEQYLFLDEFTATEYYFSAQGEYYIIAEIEGTDFTYFTLDNQIYEVSYGYNIFSLKTSDFLLWQNSVIRIDPSNLQHFKTLTVEPLFLSEGEVETYLDDDIEISENVEVNFQAGGPISILFRINFPYNWLRVELQNETSDSTMLKRIHDTVDYPTVDPLFYCLFIERGTYIRYDVNLEPGNYNLLLQGNGSIEYKILVNSDWDKDEINDVDEIQQSDFYINFNLNPTIPDVWGFFEKADGDLLGSIIEEEDFTEGYFSFYLPEPYENYELSMKVSSGEFKKMIVDNDTFTYKNDVFISNRDCPPIIDVYSTLLEAGWHYISYKHKANYTSEIEFRINGNPIKVLKFSELRDTDGDGVKDLEEYSNGMNPSKIDTDEDGIPDNLDSSPLAKLKLEPNQINQIIVPTDVNKDTLINIQIKKPEIDYSTYGVPRLWKGEYNVSIYPVLRMFGNKFDRYHFTTRINEFNFEWNLIYQDYSYYPLDGFYWKAMWLELYSEAWLLWYLNDILPNYYWIDTGDYDEFKALIDTYYDDGFRAFRMFPTLSLTDHNSKFSYGFSEGIILIPKGWYDNQEIEKKEEMSMQKLIHYWRPNTNVELLLKSVENHDENGFGDPLPNPSDPNDEFYFVYPKPAEKTIDYGIRIPQGHPSKTNDNLLDIRFDFIWLVTRFDDETGETSLLHYYDFEEDIIVQSLNIREISNINYILGSPDSFIENQILWTLTQNPTLGTLEEFGVLDDVVGQGTVSYFDLASQAAIDRKNQPLEEGETEVLYIAGSYQNFDLLNKIYLNELPNPEFSDLYQGDFTAHFSSYSISNVYEDQDFFIGDPEIQGESKILYQIFYNDFGNSDVQQRASIIGIPIAMETAVSSKVLKISQAQGFNVPLNEIPWDLSSLSDRIAIQHETYIERDSQSEGIPFLNFEDEVDIYKECITNRQGEVELSDLFFRDTSSTQTPAELFQSFIENYWNQIGSLSDSLTLLEDFVTETEVSFPKEDLSEIINLLLEKVNSFKLHPDLAKDDYSKFFQFSQELETETSQLINTFNIIQSQYFVASDYAAGFFGLAMNFGEELAKLSEGYHENLAENVQDNRVNADQKQHVEVKNNNVDTTFSQRTKVRLKLSSTGLVCVAISIIMVYCAIQEIFQLEARKGEYDNVHEWRLRYTKAVFLAFAGALLFVEGVLLITSALKDTLAKSLASSISVLGFIAFGVSLVMFLIDSINFFDTIFSGDYDSLEVEIANFVLSALGTASAAIIALAPAGSVLLGPGIVLGLSVALACFLTWLISSLTNDPHITLLKDESSLIFSDATKLNMRRHGGLEVGDKIDFRLCIDNDGDNPFYMRARFKVSGEGWTAPWTSWQGLWGDGYSCEGSWYGTAGRIDYDEYFSSTIVGTSPDVTFNLEFQADYALYDFWDDLVGSGWSREVGVRETIIQSLSMPALENTIKLFNSSTSEFFSYSVLLEEFHSAIDEFRYKDAHFAASKVLSYISKEVLKYLPLYWYDSYEEGLQEHTLPYPFSDYYLLQTTTFEEWFWLMYNFYDSGFRACILSDDIEDAVEFFNYYVALNIGSITINEWLAVSVRDFEFCHHLFSWGSSGFWMWVPKDWWAYTKPKVDIFHQILNTLPLLSTNIRIDWEKTTFESDPILGLIDVNLKLFLEGPDYGTTVKFEITPPEGFSISPQNIFTDSIDSTISFTITWEDSGIEPGEYSFDLRLYLDGDIPELIFEDSVPFVIEGFHRVEFLQHEVIDPIIPGEFFEIIEITNTGTYAETINITVEGIPESFIYKDLYPDDLLEDIFLLEPGETRIALVINPPRHHTTSPGIYTYQFRAQDHLHDTFDEIFSGTFEITAFSDMDFQLMSITPGDMIFDYQKAIYTYNLTNMGNVNQTFQISYDNITFADESLNKNTILLEPGEWQLVTLTLDPIGWGNQAFNINASSEYNSSMIELNITILDDDITPPNIIGFEIIDTPMDVTIIFKVLNEIDGDDCGLSGITIYIDGVAFDFDPDSTDTEFSFTFNDTHGGWFMELGFHEINVSVIDNDDDVLNDALSNYTIGTFETTFDDMGEYMKWRIGNLNEKLQTSSDDYWRNPVDSHKKALDEKLTALTHMFDTLNFLDAYNKMLHDIKPKLTGLKTDENGNPWGNGVFNNPWVENQDFQEELWNECNELLSFIQILMSIN